jgi:GH25 family lysozyme M1 (1,4-beta-N-acetylmuramidase)
LASGQVRDRAFPYTPVTVDLDPGGTMTKSRVWLLAMSCVAGLGVFGLAGMVSGAGVPGAAAVAAPLQGPRVSVHFNVGATHSPQLLRQLARPGTAGPDSAGAALAGAKRGVDVASYQERSGISWARVAAAGIQFAVIKATEGDYYRNPHSPADLTAARAAGLSVLTYAFAIPNGAGASANPVTQADYLVSYLQSSGVSPLPPLVLDIEYNPYSGGECYGLSQTAMVSWVQAFTGEVQRRTGRQPVIYTPPSWWQTCTGGSAAFGETPLWVPYYTTASSPVLVPGWWRWALWQYTSSGTVSGINTAGSTDLDQLTPATVPLLDPGRLTGRVGNWVNVKVAPVDRISGVSLSFSAAGLPPGLAISQWGRIKGDLKSRGRYWVKVHVRASNGLTGSVGFRWVVS